MLRAVPPARAIASCEALRRGASLGQAGRRRRTRRRAASRAATGRRWRSRRPRAARPAWDRRAGIARRRPMPPPAARGRLRPRRWAGSRPEPPTEDRARCRAAWPRGAGAPRRTRRGARRAGPGRGPRRPRRSPTRRAWSSSVRAALEEPGDAGPPRPPLPLQRDRLLAHRLDARAEGGEPGGAVPPPDAALDDLEQDVERVEQPVPAGGPDHGRLDELEAALLHGQRGTRRGSRCPPWRRNGATAARDRACRTSCRSGRGGVPSARACRTCSAGAATTDSRPA